MGKTVISFVLVVLAGIPIAVHLALDVGEGREAPDEILYVAVFAGAAAALASSVDRR